MQLQTSADATAESYCKRLGRKCIWNNETDSAGKANKVIKSNLIIRILLRVMFFRALTLALRASLSLSPSFLLRVSSSFLPTVSPLSGKLLSLSVCLSFSLVLSASAYLSVFLSLSLIFIIIIIIFRTLSLKEAKIFFFLRISTLILIC